MSGIEEVLARLAAFAERQQAKADGGDYYAGVAFGVEEAIRCVRQEIEFERYLASMDLAWRCVNSNTEASGQ